MPAIYGGKGIGGKGVGQGKTGVVQQKRRSKNAAIANVNKPSIRRLARRGGVKRISSFIYDESR